MLLFDRRIQEPESVYSPVFVYQAEFVFVDTSILVNSSAFPATNGLLFIG
jgi:hypothetical protein